MRKSRQFVKDYTMGCSNEIEDGVYHEWLTPEQALAALEIERKEMIDEIYKWLKENAGKYIAEHPFRGDVDFEEDKMIEDLRHENLDSVR